MTPPKLTPIDYQPEAPLVSVVMPAFNRASFLKESVRTVLAQSVQSLEIIICDDHSTDDTPRVAANLVEQDRRIHYMRTSRKGGVALALNEGICRSRGKYIQICHDHDIYLPPLLERLSTIMDNNPSVVFAHSGIQWCDHLGNPLSNARFVMGYPEVTLGFQWRRKMLQQMASPVSALSMIRRSALEEAGLFDPDYGITTDVEMWLRLCAIGDVGYANDLLIYVRGREPGHPYSGTNWQMIDEVIRAHRKHLELAYAGGPYLLKRIFKEYDIDKMLLKCFLRSVVTRQKNEVRLGRQYLRDHGIFLSRIAGWVL